MNARRRPDGPRARGFLAAPAVTLGLIGLVALAFGNAIPEELTYDAQTVIGNNPMIEPASPWWVPFTTNYWGDKEYDGLYRPMTLLALRWEHGVLGFGKVPQGYVAVNILLHALTTLLVWRLALAWLSSARGAVAAAALFAVHPLATAVVPNIVGISDILVALFSVASLLALEAGRRRGGWGWPVLAAVWWLAALLAKESAIVVPALALLRELSRGGDSEIRHGMRRSLNRWAPYLPMAVAGAAWLLARAGALTGRGERYIAIVDNPLVLESLPARLMTGLGLLGSYLLQALAPTTLSPDYSFDQVPIVRSPASGPFLLSAAALAVTAAAALLLWRRSRGPAVGLLFFLTAIAPFCNILFLVGAIRADRLLYLPMIGLALCFGDLVDRAMGWAAGAVGTASSSRSSRRTWMRAAPALAAGLLLAACALATRVHNRAWATNLSLWEHAVVAAPGNVKAHYSLARYLMASPDPPAERIQEHLEAAVAIARRLPGDEYNEPHQQLGRAYIMIAARHVGRDGLIGGEGRSWLERAVSVLREAEQRQEFQGRRRAWWERVRSSDTVQGRRLAAHAAQFGSPDVPLMLGTALEQLGRVGEATIEVEKAVAIAPGRADLQYQLGLAYSHERRFEDAERAMESAARLDPRVEEHWAGLAAVRLEQGKFAQAIDALREGRASRRGSQELERSLRALYVESVDRLRRSGREVEASALQKQAIERDGLPPSAFPQARPP